MSMIFTYLPSVQRQKETKGKSCYQNKSHTFPTSKFKKFALWYERSNLLLSSSSSSLSQCWLVQEAGFHPSFTDRGCPYGPQRLKDARGIPPWEAAGAHSSLTGCACLWRLPCCLGEGGEGKTSSGLLCRAARTGSGEVWASGGLKEPLPCPALLPWHWPWRACRRHPLPCRYHLKQPPLR